MLAFREEKVQEFQGVSSGHQAGVGIYVLPPLFLSKIHREQSANCYGERNTEIIEIYAADYSYYYGEEDLIWIEISKVVG